MTRRPNPPVVWSARHGALLALAILLCVLTVVTATQCYADELTDAKALGKQLAPTTFVDIGAGLPGVQWPGIDWGDYDNDGDLDILLTGRTSGSSGFSRVYNNDNGTFTDIGAGLADVYDSSVDWGDYDNDGDLDILLTGQYVSKVYRNDGGTFTDINAGLTGVNVSSAAWGDYDNDGDLDILLAGYLGDAGTTILYRNDDGTFVDAEAGLPAVWAGAVAWGDYDNDGDLDILLAGNDISRVYQNDDGVFTDIGAGLTPVHEASAAWGDYDSDGDLDIVLAGLEGVVSITKVYRNNDGTFEDLNAGLAGIDSGEVAWGDYDNDGDLDIILTGYHAPGGLTLVYDNINGTFSYMTVTGLQSVWKSAAAWGDYDNDGDLDVLLAGYPDGELRDHRLPQRLRLCRYSSDRARQSGLQCERHRGNPELGRC